jgi:uncharacterized membrane protein YraQ (UPF0718 family)
MKKSGGKGMNVNNILLAVIAFILLIVAYLQDKGVCLSGLRIGGKMFIDVLPLLVAAFIIAGLVQVLLPKEIISRWLSDRVGFKGILIACLAGAVTPGGPYVSFPIAFSLYKSGAGIGCVIAYLAAWKMWIITGIPFELAFLGPRITLLLRVSLFVFPPIIGFIAWRLSSWIKL